MVGAEEVAFVARGERIALDRQTAAAVPFLEALLADRVNTVKNEAGDPVIDRDPVLVKAVVQYATSGHALHLFAKLPKTSSAKAMLTELDFFCLEPPPVHPMDDASFKQALKDVKDEYEKMCRRGPVEKTRSANRFGARNAAAELAVGLETEKYDIAIGRIRHQLYNNVLFILSHSRTFGPRLRHHVWAVAKSKVQFSPKQHSELQSWVDTDDEDSSDGSDRSVSSASGEYCGSSDYSYCGYCSD
mmetsp:Transcript_150522/g.464471  ORF Transcript_150522/g.464471 Transcript_150522/m.464471 type:complete len:245 (+) Transcript_150522:107-841(+)